MILKSIIKIIFFCGVFFCCKNKNYIVTPVNLDRAKNIEVEDSIIKWGKLKQFNDLKFYLYCFNAESFFKKKIDILKFIKLFDTIPIYTMNLLAREVKNSKDTFEISFDFFDDTTSIYTYSRIGKFWDGFVFYKNSLLWLKVGSGYAYGNLSDPNKLQNDFYQDTLKAYEVFRTKQNNLNPWLYNECKRRKIF